ncbi:MAG: AraC family transcriptional regulator [Gemmatimonadaceae bacterium]|nr:AraC family transcriptional regulator [Gemmatimonadaceae bacterium]
MLAHLSALGVHVRTAVWAPEDDRAFATRLARYCARNLVALERLSALRAAHRRGARIVSICTGAFVLAEAGLLNGRRATTHWLDVPEFRRRYPQVECDPDVLYVDEGDVLTSAGIASGIDLCLHVVRRDYGATVSNAVARRIGYDVETQQSSRVRSCECTRAASCAHCRDTSGV